ncbi:MAG: hypothetical protein WD733_21785 [Bryobacterales bacterium]
MDTTLATLAGLFLPAILNATVIVAFWTPTKIIVATDGKASIGGRLGSKQTTVCKIHQLGERYYAVSGLSEEPETGFNLDAIVKDLARQADTILDLADLLEARVRPPMLRALAHIRQKYPQNYEADFGPSSGGVVLQVVLFGLEHGRLAMVTRQIGTRDFSDLNRRLDYTRSQPTEFGAIYAGQHGAIDRFRSDNPNWREGADLTATVLSFVELELNRSDLQHRNSVGPPVTILEVTVEGSTWVLPGVCPTG